MGYFPADRRARCGEAKEISGEVWLMLVLNDLGVRKPVLLRMLRRWSWLRMESLCGEASRVVSIEVTEM